MFITPKVVLLGQMFLTRYEACQTKIICQSYVPRKLKHQFTQKEPIFLVLHLLMLGFWMFRVLHCFSKIIRPLSLIVKYFKGTQPPHLFSEINCHRPSQFISILFVNIFQLFDINEMKHYFRCISMFMSISIFYCVPT